MISHPLSEAAGIWRMSVKFKCGNPVKGRIVPEHGPEQHLELLNLFRIADALVLREEARQVSSVCARRQDRHDRIAGLPVGAVQRDAHLVPDPIYHRAAADIDGVSVSCRASSLRRPTSP